MILGARWQLTKSRTTIKRLLDSTKFPSQPYMGNINSNPIHDRTVVVSAYAPPPESMSPGAGFDALPAEILLKIVQLTGTPIKMSVVCSTLRAICITHATLWTSIVLDTCQSVASLQLRFKRSRTLPLDIRVAITSLRGIKLPPHSYNGNLASCVDTHTFPPSTLKPIIPLFRQQVERVQTLTLDFNITSGDWDLAAQILADFNTVTPRMRSLAIHGLDSHPSTLPSDFLESGHTELQTFLFVGSVSWIPAIGRRLSSQTLTRLSLGINPFELGNHSSVDLLRPLRDHSSTLVEVGLSVMMSNLAAEHHCLKSSSSDMIEMPSLKRLVLGGIVAPLSSIYASSLETFYFMSPTLSSGDRPSSGPFSPTPCCIARSSLITFLQQHANTLKDIFMRVRCSHHELHSFPPMSPISLPLLHTLAVETWGLFRDQLVVIAAAIDTFIYIPHGDIPAWDIFSYTNQYSATVRILEVVGAPSGIHLQIFTAPGPTSYPQLHHVSVRAPPTTIYYPLIDDARLFSRGALPILLTFGRHFEWTAILDHSGQLVLDGTARP